MSERETGDGSSTRTGAELSDSLAATLSASRRKQILSVLSSGPDRWEFDDLVLAVASRADGIDPAGSTEENERLAVSLHHRHLPKLADQGLVEYEPDGGETRLTSMGAECAAAFCVQPRD